MSDVDRLVELITQRVKERLDGRPLTKLNVLPRDRGECNDDTAPGEDCTGCGVCVVRRPWSVRAMEDAGARKSMIFTDFGVGTTTAKVGPALTRTMMTEMCAGDPDVVVVNLGTNDVMSGSPTELTVESLRQILDRFPDACRLLVTVNESMYDADDPDLQSSIAALNERIRQLADETGSGLIDWNQHVGDYLAQGEPEGQLLTDTVHPTGVGQQAMADLYRESVESC